MTPAITAIPPFHFPAISSNNVDNNSHVHYRRLLPCINECTDMSQLKQIHAQTLRTTSTNSPYTFFLYSRILHVSSFSDIDYAFRLFNHIDYPNSFMWNTLIRACARSIDHKEQAIVLYHRMLKEGSVVPDKHTFPFVLKACAYLFALSEGIQTHAQIWKRGFELDVYINNSLIHLYSTCGCLDFARKVFDKMGEKSVVSWNVLIDAFVQAGEFDTALRIFVEMQNSFEPDGYTVQSLATACAGLGALSLGMWAHAYVLRNCDDRVASDILVNTSLVDMYCKCGSLEIAQQVFERMSKHDVNSWNAMILGLAMHGQGNAALEYFQSMIRTERLEPNSVTFVGVLSACNHNGMVDKGRKFFDMMITKFKIKPRLEHYGCLVDLLARAGLIDEALDFVLNMPIKPDLVIWRSLLDACCKNNASIELSEEVARQVFESEGGDCSGAYMLLSKVYASASRWNDVGLVRKLMDDRSVTKEPGCSSIEIDGVAHDFFAGDTSHPQTNEIYQLVDVIEESLESMGYVPDFSQAPMVDELNEEKQHSLRFHSERLAIAFGLLSTKPGMPIRVYKNLRVCNDCHRVTKLISKMFNREIIMRDRARFHHFKDGLCSCKDYW